MKLNKNVSIVKTIIVTTILIFYIVITFIYQLFPHEQIWATGKFIFNVYSKSKAIVLYYCLPKNKDYVWIKVSEKTNFAHRDGAGALTFQNQMWLLGGWNTKNKDYFPMLTNNEVWSSRNGTKWDLQKTNTFISPCFNEEIDWEGRHSAGYVVYKNKMWIIGGDAIQGHYQYDVWNSEDGKKWTWVNKNHPVPWGPRIFHYTVVFKNKIWIMGGQTLPQHAKAKEVFYSDIWNTSDGINWRRITLQHQGWSARGAICGGVVFKNRIWILGGGTYETPNNGRRYYNDVWSSSDGEHWICHVKSAPWKPRQYHNVVIFDNRIWVIAGYNEDDIGGVWYSGNEDVNGDRNDVWYSDDGVNWQEYFNVPFKIRHASSVFVYNNALWVVAGSNKESDVWRLQSLSNNNLLLEANNKRLLKKNNPQLNGAFD